MRTVATRRGDLTPPADGGSRLDGFPRLFRAACGLSLVHTRRYSLRGFRCAREL